MPGMLKADYEYKVLTGRNAVPEAVCPSCGFEPSTFVGKCVTCYGMHAQSLLPRLGDPIKYAAAWDDLTNGHPILKKPLGE